MLENNGIQYESKWRGNNEGDQSFKIESYKVENLSDCEIKVSHSFHERSDYKDRKGGPLEMKTSAMFKLKRRYGDKCHK